MGFDIKIIHQILQPHTRMHHVVINVIISVIAMFDFV